jgi:cytochrome c biogenesis protein CcdA
MLKEVTIILGLALIDSINPASISTHLILLTKVDQKKWATAFIFSTFATYFISGLLIYFGVLSMIEEVIAPLLSNGAVWLEAIKLIAGLCLLTFGFIRAFKTGNKAEKARPISAFLLSPAGITILGVTSTIADVPTALPYLGWLTHLGNMHYSTTQVIVLCFVYNIIYISPLALIQFLFIRNEERITSVTINLKEWLRRISHWLIIGVCVVGGGWLSWTALQSMTG